MRDRASEYPEKAPARGLVNRRRVARLAGRVDMDRGIDAIICHAEPSRNRVGEDLPIRDDVAVAGEIRGGDSHPP